MSLIELSWTAKKDTKECRNCDKIGQNFALFMHKRAPARKKYTTASGGGGEYY